MLMNKIICLLLIALGMGFVKAGELINQPPVCKWQGSLSSVFHEDPKKFAEVLTGELSTLKSIIPIATPSEKDWLKNELQGDVNRHIRARSSLIYAQVELEEIVVNGLASLEFLTGKRTAKIAHSMSWSFFAAQVLGQSSHIGDHTQRLVSSKLIRRESLPRMWILLSSTDQHISEDVAFHHRNIVEHILTCILPTVTVQQNP